MSPPRHTLVFIPPKSGIALKNLENLNALMRRANAGSNSEGNTANFNREMNEIYNKIMVAGGHATRANAKRVTARPLDLYRALARVTRANAKRRMQQAITQPHLFPNGTTRTNIAIWHAVQKAAGRFKALGKVRAMRKSGNNVSPNKLLLNEHKLHALATFMRPYMLREASPVRTSRAAYKARETLAREKVLALQVAEQRRRRQAKAAANKAAAESARRASSASARAARSAHRRPPTPPKKSQG